ncbi:MAG: YlmC/YmxH family sporulation protein [Faecalibacterium sp.]|nr:YlmC/YmxH family sporulation protein [Ruminococcus sp.]MCM1391572.1 YlmC/YmxH family sporulation protein [Ruminococcus sp.]MCM1485129.1 YlmC/YmxH family sporulation protein [Faecalibacterium sp.]
MGCCSITDLRSKEVISAKTGCRIGNVSDVEIDTCDGKLVSLIIWGKGRCFGMFGRDEDICIPWEDIEVIGDDTILVCKEIQHRPPPNRRGIFDGLFRN